MHRMWFDSTYDYPQANGCKLWPDGNWDESQEKEMAFRRVNNWLDKYFGEGHGITLALTECGFFEENGDPSADVIAVWYASHLGTFAEHNVSIFTPWSWYTGMWEVMNLFSHNAKEISVSSETSDKTAVTGFTTLSRNRDSLTLILVNHTTEKQNADVSLDGFEASDGEYTVLQLSDLPESETFVSHSDNALEESSVSLVSNSFAMDLPGYSVTAVLLSGSGSSVANAAEFYKERGYSLSTTGRGVISLAMDKRAEIEVDLYNIAGRHVQSLYKGVPETGVAELKPGVESGVYCIRVKNQTGVVVSEKIVLTR